MKRLAEETRDFPCVQCVRGRGLMIGVVLDQPAGPLLDLCLKRNLVVLTAGETVLRLLPPLTIIREEADCAITRIVDAIAEFCSK